MAFVFKGIVGINFLLDCASNVEVDSMEINSVFIQDKDIHFSRFLQKVTKIWRQVREDLQHSSQYLCLRHDKYLLGIQFKMYLIGSKNPDRIVHSVIFYPFFLSGLQKQNSGVCSV